MFKKIIPVFIALLLFSEASHAQSIREKINKQAKDPKREENAAKADVYIVDNKEISSKKNKNKNACKPGCTKARQMKKQLRNKH